MENKRFRWDCINDRIKHIEKPVGAEIGVFKGECSGHLMQLHPGLKLYLVDLWSSDSYKDKSDDSATLQYRQIYEKECKDNLKFVTELKNYYSGRLEIIQSDSVKAAELFENESLDFAFVDADHSYFAVKADILAWLPKIKKLGCIMGHDYGIFDGVKKAVDEIFKNIETDSDYFWSVRV